MTKEDFLTIGMDLQEKSREPVITIRKFPKQVPTAIIAVLTFLVISACILALNPESQLAFLGLTNPKSALLFLLAVPSFFRKLIR